MAGPGAGRQRRLARRNPRHSRVARAALLYAGGHDLSDPRLSPRHATLWNLPPTMVQASTDEVLMPDVRRFTEQARAAGADVHLVEGRGLPQGWGTMPLAQEAAAARRLLIDHLSV